MACLGLYSSRSVSCTHSGGCVCGQFAARPAANSTIVGAGLVSADCIACEQAYLPGCQTGLLRGLVSGALKAMMRPHTFLDFPRPRVQSYLCVGAKRDRVIRRGIASDARERACELTCTCAREFSRRGQAKQGHDESHTVKAGASPCQLGVRWGSGAIVRCQHGQLSFRL